MANSNHQKSDPFAPLPMKRGPDWANRFMLAPMTNQQSHRDGVLSDDEFHWLTMRSRGGFGLTMTCASHVSEQGIGFPGQLGIWSDRHVDGLSRLADQLNADGTHSVVQLHHAGMRTPIDLIDGPAVSPSGDEETGAIALTADGVERLKDDFVLAAKRAEQAGFHGVQLHGAHGYLLCQFLSPEINQRTDRYGGSLENRSRILFDLVDRVREACGADFSLGVRLSPERFGMKLDEVVTIAQRLMQDGIIDYLDMSLWDVFKMPETPIVEGKALLAYFTELDRGEVQLGAAGNIRTGRDVQAALDAGLDFVGIGRAAVLHHDFPAKVALNREFQPQALPVTSEYLQAEGLGEAFIEYMQRWDGFVKPS